MLTGFVELILKNHDYDKFFNSESMKFFFVLFLFPLQIFAQDISGVWKGNLYNDTTKQLMPYELAVNDRNGKLNGYSYTVFLIDSIKNIGVKSVKIKNKNERFFVEDDKLIYNNYVEPPAKGVRMFSILSYSQNDSSEVLSGSWNTNRTKDYNALTGNIFLEKKKKIKETAIVQKLHEIGLADKLLFVGSEESQEQKNIGNSSVAANENAENQRNISGGLKVEKAQNSTAINQIQKNEADNLKRIESNALPKVALKKTTAEKEILKEKSIEKNSVAVIGKIIPEQKNTDGNEKNIVVEEAKKEKVEKEIPDKNDVKPNKNIAIISNEEKNQDKKINTEIIKEETGKVFNQPIKKEVKKEKIPEKSVVAVKEKADDDFKNNKIIKEVPVMSNKIPVTPPAAQIAFRKIETIETVEIIQDSLVLSLFDNGTIDGDTVSILINGKVVWPRVNLLEKAANKTIYLTPEMGDSISVVMYAESLGTIPPNTGLLVIRDGKINHEIRFSGDLKKNSAIILKRKSKSH